MRQPTAGFVLARPDVSARRTAEGVWIGNGAVSFTVKGAAAFGLVSALLDALDGNRALDDVLGDFPAGARPAEEKLAGALVAHGCAVRLDAPLSRYAEERGAAAGWLIPSFAQLTREPVDALDAVLATTLILIGRPGWLDRMRRTLEASPLPGLRVEYHAPEMSPDLRRDGLLVVADADASAHEDTVRLQDSLLENGIPHGIAGNAGSRYWILWSDEDSTGCWDCLHRYQRTWPAHTESTSDEAATSLLVSLLYHRCAGLDTTAVEMTVDAGLPTVTRHPGWRGSGCRCHRAKARDPRPAPAAPLVRRNVVRPQDEKQLHDDNDRIIAALAGWTDPRIGPVLDVDGGELPQIPYGQARAEVLVDLPGRAHVRSVHAATLSSREAFYQAALNGLELIADPSDTGPVSRNLGAGWSRDEALYRALLRSVLRGPLDGSASAPITDDDLGDGECGRVSRYLARVAPPQLRWAGARLPNGLHHATGTGPGGDVVHGLGACYAEAVSMALLRLVNDDGVLVPLNPHHRTWAQVWARITPPSKIETHTLPFAGEQIQLVEVA